MDYFFQEQRWTDTFLSLHVKKFKRIILFLLIAFSAAGAKAQSNVKFNDYVRYSQWVIDSRLSDFYGNRKKFGFNTYDSNLNSKNTVSTWYKEDGTNYSIQVDYVAGLVAKATIEAAEYYKNCDWSKPWFKSVEWYGNKCSVPTSPDNLDAINASKMYFGIYNLTNSTNGAFKDDATASKATEQLGNALTALKYYNNHYAFAANTKLNGNDIAGGWYHKSIYPKQMWLDGQYMGPALLAQLINGYSSYKNNKVSEDDWSLITKQFTIVWEQCWDSENELLYHAFSSEPLSYWTSDAEIWTTAQKTLTKWTKMTAPGHSAAFWGRAEGWYFLALVDVLEQMQIAGLTQSTNYTTLKGYLDKLALGIAKRQDATSGCWYQLVGKEGSYKASYYNGNPANEKSNYLESSCTAIFTAAYLKAIRLGLLEKDTYFSIAEKAYKGMVKQFMKQRTDGTVDLLGCCKSAGLGTNALGHEKFRDGSNAYYLHGYDVTPTSTNSGDYYTEGKVLGAFIMAATEYERQYQKSTLLSKDLNKTYNLSSNQSLTVEVLGDGKPKYQWYNATGTTPSAIDGATNASYTPTQSGKYYCKITVTPPSSTAAKTRAASTEPYTITTSTADVTVRGTSTGDTGNAGNAGEKVLFYTDFTESDWNGVATTSSSTSTTANINGTQVTLKGYSNSTGFSVSNGTMTFPGNNMSSSNYYIAIPVTGVNGSITIEFGGTNGYTYRYDICTKDGTPSTTETGKVANGVVTITEDYSGTDAIIYIGGSSSNYKTISSIKITTPSSSTPTTYTVTATAANGTVTITDGSGNTIESGSQVNYGTKLVFTATANSDYEFSSWSVNGTTGTESGTTYTIASLTKATSVTATFTKTSSGGGNNDQPTYVYKVSEAGLTAPSINSSKYITTNNDGETGEKLVKMTFGGWKWNGGKYKKPGGTNEITDSWTASETQAAGVTALDGFQYWFRGTQDAAHEKKDSVSFMYGKNRYGWFVSPTRKDGITTESHPYTLPVRGSFMTFEPTMNGTLTIYILQNGVWNSDTKNHIDIIPGEFRMHAFQITNQRGLVLAEFAPKYSVTNNQMVNPDYKCTKFLEADRPKSTDFNKTSKDVSDWEEFWTLSYDERKAVHDSWSDAKNNTPQKIIKLDNGSFLAIQKAVVKYQFHVTGNETYYLFSNFSKMGFSGATFQPDAAQPTDEATFSGAKSLSDTKAYTPIKMESDGTTIGGTGLTNYKYTINGEEVGKVDGVFIPQFKKITLNRTFKPNQWTTLSLPFNLTQTEVEQIFGKGTQIIVFDKAKITSARTYLTFFYHEIQNVLPGYPYLIRPTLVDANDNQMETKSNSTDNTPTYTITKDGDKLTLTEFTVYNKAINPHITQHEFKSGGYTAKCTPSYCTANENGNYSKRYEEGDIFVSEGNGTVYISEGQSYGKGYRSYIDYTGTTAPAKALSISFSGVEDDDDNGTTTEIRVTELADDVIQTLGIGGVYNLNGQKVADTTRNLPAGIYIVNGRKVVVK